MAAFLIGGGLGPLPAGSGRRESRSVRVKAANAALHETRGGRVTETEFEDGTYDIEVVLLDGRRVEVDLDRNLEVASTRADDD